VSLTEPFPYGLLRSRNTWDRLIKRYGDLALLRQPGQPDLFVSYMFASVTPAERLGGVSNPLDKKVLVSAIDPNTQAPLARDPSERDVIVTIELNDDGSPVIVNGNHVEDELFKLYTPPGLAGPSRKQLYWRLFVRS
jgi:hypothetical protein